MFGSSLAQGDQASQRWKSFTWVNTLAGAPAMVAVRTTRYSAGWKATTMQNTTMATARPSTIFLSMGAGVGVEADGVGSGRSAARHEHRAIVRAVGPGEVELDAENHERHRQAGRR